MPVSSEQLSAQLNLKFFDRDPLQLIAAFACSKYEVECAWLELCKLYEEGP